MKLRLDLHRWNYAGVEKKNSNRSFRGHRPSEGDHERRGDERIWFTSTGDHDHPQGTTTVFMDGASGIPQSELDVERYKTESQLVRIEYRRVSTPFPGMFSSGEQVGMKRGGEGDGDGGGEQQELVSPTIEGSNEDLLPTDKFPPAGLGGKLSTIHSEGTGEGRHPITAIFPDSPGPTVATEPGGADATGAVADAATAGVDPASASRLSRVGILFCSHQSPGRFFLEACSMLLLQYYGKIRSTTVVICQFCRTVVTSSKCVPQ